MLRRSPWVPQTRMKRSRNTPGTTAHRTLTPWIVLFEDLTLLVGYSQLHAVGTSAISRRGVSWGVLDPDLRVKGTKGLRVADSSALPYVPTAHSKFVLSADYQCLIVVNSARAGVSPRRGCCRENKGGVLIYHPRCM